MGIQNIRPIHVARSVVVNKIDYLRNESERDGTINIEIEMKINSKSQDDPDLLPQLEIHLARSLWTRGSPVCRDTPR